MCASVVNEDFGKPVARKHKATGTFQPYDSIGTSLADLPHSVETRRRHLDHDFDHDDVYLEMGALTIPEPAAYSRIKKPVIDGGGRSVTALRPSSSSGRPGGVRQTDPLDQLPSLRREPMLGSKQCFPWAYRPTGYENPSSYEEPAAPGARPSHPVPAVGLVSLGHRRAFPEREVKTSIPSRRCKAPTGSEWGGWAKNGAPGRAPLDRPWEVEPEGPGADGLRVTDARIRQFPELRIPRTAHLTQWHTDPRAHIDPIKRSRVHHSEPMQQAARSGSLTDRSEAHRRSGEAMRGAGKPTGCHVEGAALSFYDRVRAEESGIFSAR